MQVIRPFNNMFKRKETWYGDDTNVDRLHSLNRYSYEMLMEPEEVVESITLRLRILEVHDP